MAIDAILVIYFIFIIICRVRHEFIAKALTSLEEFSRATSCISGQAVGPAVVVTAVIWLRSNAVSHALWIDVVAPTIVLHIVSAVPVHPNAVARGQAPSLAVDQGAVVTPCPLMHVALWVPPEEVGTACKMQSSGAVAVHDAWTSGKTTHLWQGGTQTCHLPQHHLQHAPNPPLLFVLRFLLCSEPLVPSWHNSAAGDWSLGSFAMPWVAGHGRSMAGTSATINMRPQELFLFTSQGQGICFAFAD